MNKVTVCISPALYSFYAQKEAIVIIVDIFRATTSMCAAFNNGTLSIHTVATVEEAIHYKEKGYLVAAERNVKKCNFADFGNSPFDFSHEKVADKEIIFTTTNGTQAVQMALDADEILIGAFSNITTLTNYCNSKKKKRTDTMLGLEQQVLLGRHPVCRCADREIDKNREILLRFRCNTCCA